MPSKADGSILKPLCGCCAAALIRTPGGAGPAAPDNLRIARQRRAIGAKDAGGVVDIVGKQLCVKAAEEIRRDRDDNDTLELAGGSDPASRHGKKRLVVEARLQAADVNLRAGLAQRAEIVAVRQVEAAAREVAGADQEVPRPVDRPGRLDLRDRKSVV